MKKMKNSYHCEGLVYQHALEAKVSGEKSKKPGTEYITGTVDIATDDDCTNIVQVHYTYVTPLTNKGTENKTYTVLANILNGTFGNVMANGKENAVKVRVDTGIALNDFYSDRTNEMVAAKRNEGGFIHTTGPWATDDLGKNRFEVDMVITGIKRQEADPEKDLPEKGILHGCIFDSYRNTMYPMDFSVLNPKAIDYFEGEEPSPKHPLFTRLKGKEVSATIKKKITEESAFGEPIVREVINSRKDFVVDWAQTDPYEWDTEDTITAEELSQLMADREVHLADVKRRYDENKAAKSGGTSFDNTPAPAPATKSSATNFDF